MCHMQFVGLAENNYVGFDFVREDGFACYVAGYVAGHAAVLIEDIHSRLAGAHGRLGIVAVIDSIVRVNES